MSTNDKYELIGGVLYNTPADETHMHIDSKKFLGAVIIADAILSAKTFTELFNSLSNVFGVYTELVDYMNSPLVDFLIAYEKLGVAILENNMLLEPHDVNEPIINHMIKLLANQYLYRDLFTTIAKYGTIAPLKFLSGDRYKHLYIKHKEIMFKIAVQSNNIDIVKWMLDRDININECGYLLNDVALPMIKLFVEYGLDIKKYSNYALISALDNQDIPIIKYLVENGADLTINNNSAIKEAVYSDNVNLVKGLVELGADIHVDKDSMLLYMVQQSYGYDMIEYLINNGADIQAHASDAIKFAIQHNRMFRLQYFIETVGINVNAYPNGLIDAIQRSNLVIVKYLVEQGADISDYNRIHEAALVQGSREILAYIRSLKPDKNGCYVM